MKNDDEFIKYLLKKIVEEATELQHAAADADIETELADIYEIIDTILALQGKNREDVDAIEIEKRNKNGGFSKRILMLGKNQN